ncbi:MAG TPA: sensor histidine kinase [Baekduia sp.]|uniref:sensor histidine kinase n=1 Tax=Baekduia sp. TaxID=2600305 RepID=UPI002CD82E80|nr:sensor histidine kinase [Baekduia sp.]HMJ35309.1 sensor histidine kinase [Baekduia sp.]
MRKPPLATQILAVNALLIVATGMAAIVAARLSLDDVVGRRQAFVLVAGILGAVLVNGIVLRRRFAPLEKVIDVMERIDLARPGVRADVPEADSDDVVRLVQAFNRMLGRIEDERSRTAAAVLQGQESERARVARDLHDECNQALTAVLLRLEAHIHSAPEELREELRETKDVAVTAMDELLRLARELRPAALDDHGLTVALRNQLERFSDQTGVPSELRCYDELTDLPDHEQTVVYRVVQESLSNITRHAAASNVLVEVGRDHGRPIVRIVDDGVGFAGTDGDGIGLVGMRERARLARGRLEVHSVPGRGTAVELRLDRDLWLAAEETRAA